MIYNFFNFYYIQYPRQNNSYFEVIGGVFLYIPISRPVFKSISLGCIMPYNINRIELVEVDKKSKTKVFPFLSLSSFGMLHLEMKNISPKFKKPYRIKKN